MKFGVLGPLRVLREDRSPVALPAGNARKVLAVLLVRAGGAVAEADLTNALWPAGPPGNAVKNVQSYISRLKRTLGEPNRIRRSPAGYGIALRPGDLDAGEFTDLIRQATSARTGGDLGRAATLLDQALELWRGEPYADIDDDFPYLAPEVQRLTQLRMAALENQADLALSLGRHADIIPRLWGLLAEQPARERLAALLMLALYRSDRQTDALGVYRHTRDVLIDEHGVEPGAELHALHQAVLRRDPNLDLPPTSPQPGSAVQRQASVVPAQLPTDIHAFAGRDTELRELDSLLDTSTPEQPAAVVITAVSGTAGVGKTALAVHWAHHIRERFPDGQLYVNLRGFDPSGTHVEPAEAIRGFLDAFDVAPERISASLDAQAALYRSLLDGKRVLVVLDNARDTDQIRPLLPGSPGCLAIATSRDNLTGLVTKEAAHPLTLDLLADTEARSLLEQRLGGQRLSTEPDATNDIIAACSGLPLALAIVAARAATHPRFPLHTLASELQGTRLDALASDTSTDVRTVLSWSYDQLTPQAQRLFRLLGLHPGPDISTFAAASLSGLAPADTRRLLIELTNSHLISETLPGRYSFHDLLRTYAAELADTHDADADRHAAIERVLDHYLHTAHAGIRMLVHLQRQIPLAPPAEGVSVELLANRDRAMAWFTTEHLPLLAVLNYAAGSGFDSHTWLLARVIAPFLMRQGHQHHEVAIWRAALAAAERAGDHPAQEHAHRFLASACIRLGSIPDARWHLRQALDLSGRLGDLTSQAHAYNTLATSFETEGNYAKAIDHARRALAIFQKSAHQDGQAYGHNTIGWYHALMGDYVQALAWCEQGLARYQQLGNQQGEAATWDSLGYTHRHLHNYETAVACYQRAVALYRQVGFRPAEAATLTHFGDLLLATKDVNAARDTWQQALAILDDLDHPDADGVRAKINDLEWHGTAPVPPL